MEQKTKHLKYSCVTKTYMINCCPAPFLLGQKKIKYSHPIILKRWSCWNSYKLWFGRIYAQYSLLFARIIFFLKSAPSGRVKSMVPLCRPFSSFSLSCIHVPEEGAGISGIMLPQPAPRGSYHKGTFMSTIASGTAKYQKLWKRGGVFLFACLFWGGKEEKQQKPTTKLTPGKSLVILTMYNRAQSELTSQ